MQHSEKIIASTATATTYVFENSKPASVTSNFKHKIITSVPMKKIAHS